MILYNYAINTVKENIKMKKISKVLLSKAVNASLKNSANSTTCATIYQPKAPVALKKFSKIDK